MEQWHPLGVVGVITAFNFPVAVWSWNAALAAVCGDATVWKPSNKTPLTAIAVIKIAERVCRETGADPAIFTLLIGDGATVGEKLADDRRIPLISATGSTRMGCEVAQDSSRRGSAARILELGGNNAIIVAPERRSRPGDALDFLRRGRHRRPALHLHASRHRARIDRGQSCGRNCLAAYKSVPHRKSARSQNADGSADRSQARSTTCSSSIERVKDEGGEILYGGERLDGESFRAAVT